MVFDIPVAEEARRLGVYRTTLVAAIRTGKCGGEEIDGYWYTSHKAAAEWYAQTYRLRDSLYSQTAGKNWSASEVKLLREMLDAGVAMTEIAGKLQREPQAVRTKVCKMRRAGELPPFDPDRQAHREGRVRLHLAPAVKVALGRAARAQGLTLATYVTRAGLAAVADPGILAIGEAEARKPCYRSSDE